LHSCILDGEAVACDDNGVPCFDRLRRRSHDGAVFLYAFDLIELNGNDLRREPLEVRKATLASVLTKARPGLRLNEHIEADGPTVFAHACKMGLEGMCPSVRRRATAPAAHPTGSSRRTRLALRCSGRWTKTGAADRDLGKPWPVRGRSRFALRLLRRVQPLSIDAGAHESARHRAGVLAVRDECSDLCHRR
jgi:bifunctional non-homologous end joining protein LigD